MYAGARRRQRAAERAVDVVRGARLVAPGPVRVGRNQPRDDRFEQIGFGRGQVLERLARGAASGACVVQRPPASAESASAVDATAAATADA